MSAPAAASSRAIARPMPRAAPVTTATVPSNDVPVLMLHLHGVPAAEEPCRNSVKMEQGSGTLQPMCRRCHLRETLR